MLSCRFYPGHAAPHVLHFHRIKLILRPSTRMRTTYKRNTHRQEVHPTTNQSHIATVTYRVNTHIKLVQIITLLHHSLPSRKLDPSLGIDSRTLAVKGVVHVSSMSIVHQSEVSGWSLASPSSQAQSPGSPHHRLQRHPHH